MTKKWIKGKSVILLFYIWNHTYNDIIDKVLFTKQIMRWLNIKFWWYINVYKCYLELVIYNLIKIINNRNI